MVKHKSIYNSRYFFLMCSLMLLFLLNPFLGTDHFSNFILAMFFSIILIFSVLAVSKGLMVYTFILSIFSFLSYAYILYGSVNQLTYLVHYGANIIFLSVISFSVISSVARSHAVSSDTLCGAISGYLLIGFMWSYIYLFIGTFDPAAFSNVGKGSFRENIDNFIYYSFVTLTTLGYGDISALNSVSKAFSWIEAVVGQVYLAVWISQLVGLRISQMK